MIFKLLEWIFDDNLHPLVFGSRFLVAILLINIIAFILVCLIMKYIDLYIISDVCICLILYFAFIHNWLVNRK